MLFFLLRLPTVVYAATVYTVFITCILLQKSLDKKREFFPNFQFLWNYAMPYIINKYIYKISQIVSHITFTIMSMCLLYITITNVSLQYHYHVLQLSQRRCMCVTIIQQEMWYMEQLSSYHKGELQTLAYKTNQKT